MSTFFTVTGLVILGAFVSYLVLLTLNRQLSWYLPAHSTSKLSRELTQSLAIVQGLSEAYRTKLSAMDATVVEVNKYLEDIEYSKAAIMAIIEAQALRQFEVLPHDTYQQILRDLCARITPRIENQLQERLQTVGSEYVLLHSLDEHSLEVNLSAEHSDWQTLQKALAKIEKFRPRTDDKGNVSWIDSQRQFNVYIGKLGEALFSLKWNGNVTFRKASNNEVAV